MLIVIAIMAIGVFSADALSKDHAAQTMEIVFALRNVKERK
jgi:hypothetical protein